MFNYAEVNEDGVVFNLLSTPKETLNSHLIPILHFDEALLGCLYVSGNNFIPPAHYAETDNNGEVVEIVTHFDIPTSTEGLIGEKEDKLIMLPSTNTQVDINLQSMIRLDFAEQAQVGFRYVDGEFLPPATEAEVLIEEQRKTQAMLAEVMGELKEKGKKRKRLSY